MPDNQSATQTLTLEAAAPVKKLGPKPVLVVSIILLVQIALFYSISTAEYIPTPPSLKIFQTAAGPWHMTAELELQTDVQELLKADDTMNREYVGPEGALNFFVAF